jgi:hypothetical protein
MTEKNGDKSPRGRLGRYLQTPGPMDDTKITRRRALCVAGALLTGGCTSKRGENEVARGSSGSLDVNTVTDQPMRHTPGPIVDIASAIPELGFRSQPRPELFVRRKCSLDSRRPP